MLEIFTAIMISAATPASVSASAQQFVSNVIPVLAPRNTGGVTDVVIKWLAQFMSH